MAQACHKDAAAISSELRPRLCICFKCWAMARAWGVSLNEILWHILLRPETTVDPSLYKVTKVTETERNGHEANTI